ncbi:MAG: phage holin family protein [Clostridiales bacterium]|nr:phage holin family protein [Clostridiales bacterium]
MMYLVAFALIALDFITGIVKGAATGTLSSTVMREGLYKKASLILLMALGCLADYAQGFIDLGISIPAAAAVCSYIGAMEIMSILENFCKINPDLAPERLTALFGIVVTTGSTDEQTTSATLSEAVAAIADAIGTVTQKAAEQEEDDTGNDGVTDETEDTASVDEITDEPTATESDTASDASEAYDDTQENTEQETDNEETDEEVDEGDSADETTTDE